MGFAAFWRLENGLANGHEVHVIVEVFAAVTHLRARQHLQLQRSRVAFVRGHVVELGTDLGHETLPDGGVHCVTPFDNPTWVFGILLFDLPSSAVLARTPMSALLGFMTKVS